MHLQDESAFDTSVSFTANVSPATFIPGIIGLLVMVVAMWRVFGKAGQPGWYCIVPFLNFVTLLKIAGKPWYWLFFLFVPFLNLYVIFVTAIDVAKAFGKGTGFGIGLVFLGPIFYSILGFGDAKYQGAQIPQRA